jgi:hypothetical protein
MELTRNAKGTIAFIIVVVIAQIWSAVSPVYKPPWEPWPPIVPFMKDYVVPFLINFYRPVLIGFAGLAVFWVWDGRRAGYFLAVLLAAVSSVFGVAVTVFNAVSQEWSGLFTAAVAVAFPSLMALWFSAQGYRSHGSDR